MKEWNPDLLEGLDLLVLSYDTRDNLRLQIGSDYNEKVRLVKDDDIVYQKTLPHVITAGKSKVLCVCLLVIVTNFIFIIIYLGSSKLFSQLLIFVFKISSTQD